MRITVVTDNSGTIRNVIASGHAGSSEKGTNIVCAAVTTLLRTAIRVLDSVDGISIRRDAGERGSLDFSVVAIQDGYDQYAKAAGDFLIVGLRDIQDEFPHDCAVTITQ